MKYFKFCKHFEHILHFNNIDLATLTNALTLFYVNSQKRLLLLITIDILDLNVIKTLVNDYIRRKLAKRQYGIKFMLEFILIHRQ